MRTPNSHPHPSEEEIHWHLTARAQARVLSGIFAVAMSLLLFFLATRSDVVDTSVKAWAIGAGILTLLPMWLWFQRGMATPPLLELIGFYMFFAYSAPALVGELRFTGALFDYGFTSGDAANALGIFAIAAGMMQLGYFIVPAATAVALPRIELDQRRLSHYALFLMWVSIGLPFVIRILPIPGGLAKFISLLTVAIPCVSIYLLTVRACRGQLSTGQRWSFALGVITYGVACIASGWLNSAAYVMLFIAVAYVRAAGRIPWVRLSIGLLLVVLLNGTKSEFRRQYWGGRIGGERVGAMEAARRTGDWLASSLVGLHELGGITEQTLTQRVNSLGFLAHVMHETPSEVPYSGIWVYQQIPLMFIPRAIWPNKPTTMSVPNDIALKYGYLREDQVGRIALETGLIPEAYMSFGITGVVIVMLLFGVFLRVFVNSCTAQHTGLIWELALWGMIRNGGLMITWSSVSYFAGFWQVMFLTVLVFLPVRLPSAHRAHVVRHP